ncbi:nucleolar protein 8 [Ochotona princeps]|uniref:nucleolar protein 8 n=1 Tax=Ochotona princeps TaxID=9978 RepID=UPI002715593C|nr:nucleolar protein 8 [Ochotona princeps]
MKASKETKRLFVGGLSQTVSEADLRSQFSRFGDVSDVEIIARKDEQGNPQKVFAYVNITAAENDLKKCMSILNKTKWKGGTLQIQLAKESFLHRLAQEREEAKAKKENSATSNSNLLEKMGAVDFHMKAVPGTEVPGHKNWVVSKFGRVLPVLHLKNQHKRKIIKYDPSKYCHNLKKIGEDFTETVPVSSLTWELQGGDDAMSKKRRGEFSDFRGPPKKIGKRLKGEGSSGSVVVSPRGHQMAESSSSVQQQATQKTPSDSVTHKSLSAPGFRTQKVRNVLFQTSSLENAWKRNSTSDDDIDSEEELRAMIAEEENSQRTPCSSINESENDAFEVVKEDFKSNVCKLDSLANLHIKTNSSGHRSNVDNDGGYDSGDTDEILAVNKTASKIKNSTECSQTEKATHRKNLKNKENCELSDPCINVRKRKSNIKPALSNGPEHLKHKLSPDSSSSEDVGSASESEGDEEYNTIMRNCPRLSLTLADLEQMAACDTQITEEDTESKSPETTTCSKMNKAPRSPRTPRGLCRGRQCINPEEIVASLLEESSCDKQKPKENFKPKFQAFKGIGSLYGEESENKSLKDSPASNNKNRSSSKQESSSISVENRFPFPNGPTSKLTSFQHTEKEHESNDTQLQRAGSVLEHQRFKVLSPSSSEKGNRASVSGLVPSKGKNSLSHRADHDKDSCQSTTEIEGARSDPGTSLRKSPKVSLRRENQDSSIHVSRTVSELSDVSAKEKHAEDNRKRLAALEARQRAKEAQKQLVRSALANVDGHPENKSTHIIFSSASESEEEDTHPQAQSRLEAELVKEPVGKASGKLFESSDDEESDSEDDSDRFKIKPQFEGRAGQKLMDLQSHFGNDDRFRMDSRFLESDSEGEQEEVNEEKTTEEEEFAAEKKQALNVVQSVLNVNLSSSSSKGSATAKKFKDIIRYDPTRHDHATYERKKDDKPKESKAKRKKKREEIEKLPEVSKEMYYNISTDLKEIFLSTKDASEKEEDSPWNEDCDGEKAQGVHSPGALSTTPKQPKGFTFSFFDSDTKDSKEETYRVETMKPGRTGCKGDPRFQDSSTSEEEDVAEDTDHRQPIPEEASLPAKQTTRFFFFSKHDERLHGSDLFWRGEGNNTSRSSWEARTHSLLMDCRKKHKEAKRKVKLK